MRVDLDAFEQMYRVDADPWDFGGSPYEQRKYDITVASLPRRRYSRCFEPGCSIGALTERLAPICDEVVALDVSPSAIATATVRLASVGGVSLSVGTIPEQWPSGDFDLIVMSEIGYYWDEPALADVVDTAWTSLVAGGDLVAVHWLGHSPDHVLDGITVHEILAQRLGESAVHHRDARFVLDVWTAS
ncbi:MAG: SAM-dependent methyltransferase [Ilumatobacteraceae bacterium]